MQKHVKYENIYRPIKYRWKELYEPWLFTHNLQVLLAVLSFSLFISSTLFPSLLDWGRTSATLSPLEWSAFILGGFCAFIFSLSSLGAFICLSTLFYKGWFGMKVPELTNFSEEYRKAIELKPKKR